MQPKLLGVRFVFGAELIFFFSQAFLASAAGREGHQGLPTGERTPRSTERIPISAAPGARWRLMVCAAVLLSCVVPRKTRDESLRACRFICCLNLVCDRAQRLVGYRWPATGASPWSCPHVVISFCPMQSQKSKRGAKQHAIGASACQKVGVEIQGRGQVDCCEGPLRERRRTAPLSRDLYPSLALPLLCALSGFLSLPPARALARCLALAVLLLPDCFLFSPLPAPPSLPVSSGGSPLQTGQGQSQESQSCQETREQERLLRPEQIMQLDRECTWARRRRRDQIDREITARYTASATPLPPHLTPTPQPS